MSDRYCSLLKNSGVKKADMTMQMSDIHIEEISRSFCTKWKRLIPHLKMKQIKKQDIGHTPGSNEDKRLHFLQQWRDEKGSDATYEKLVKALLQTECVDEAEGICSIVLKSVQQEELSSTQSASQDAVSIENGSCADTLDPSIRMDLVHKLTENYTNLRRKYASFTYNLCKCLNRKAITVRELCSLLKGCDIPSDIMVQLRGAATLDDVFDIIHDECATYFHYDIFESMKNEFCTPADCESNPKLNYSKHFKEYVNLHKISEFFLINPTLKTKYRDSSTELLFKIKNFRMDHKVSKLVNLRDGIATILGKRPSTLELVKVEEGCLVVTFLISVTVAETLFSCDEISANQVREFRALSIVWMKCGDKIVEIQSATTSDPDSDPGAEGTLYSTNDELDDETETVTINYAKIRGSFAALTMKVTERLEKRRPDMKSFRLHMLNILSSGDIFTDSVTVSDCFEAISSHKLSSYWNYNLIENIASQFGGDDTELKVWINDYKSALSRFKATTRIVDYMKVCQDEEELADSDQSFHQNIAQYDKSYYRKLTVKLKSCIADKSLHYIDQFWQSIADHFLLSSLSVLLENIKEGCEEVTWLVPALSALQIQYNIQDSTTFFKGNGVVRLIMDSETLYREDEQDEEYLNKEFLSLCRRGDLDGIVALLACGVSVDTPKTENGDTTLIRACFDGRIELVKFLLEHGANVHAQNKSDHTAMHVCCQEGHLDIVKILQSHGASLEATTKNSGTPLFSACWKGRIEVVRFLLEHGANVHALDKGGYTAMHVSCEKGHLDIVKALQSHGASLEAAKKNGNIPLIRACFDGRIELVKFLLEHGVNVYAQRESDHTAMHVSCQEGHLDIVKILQSHGASLEATTKNSGTPLFSACWKGRIEVVRFLLEHGANVHARDKGGYTATHVSCEKGHLDIVKVLQSHGASVEDIAKDDITLPKASYKGQTEMVKFLLEHGAKVDARDKDGKTAMHLSCGQGHLDIVKVLQSHGASHTTAKDGSTPLMSACIEGHVDVVQCLLEQNPSLINAQTQSGWSALMVASNKGSLEVVKLLLETNTAAVNCREKSAGWTALLFAAKNGYLPVLRMLIEYGANLTLKATDDVTAYDVAVINDQQEVCEELKRHGYQPAAPRHTTPLPAAPRPAERHTAPLPAAPRPAELEKMKEHRLQRSPHTALPQYGRGTL